MMKNSKLKRATSLLMVFVVLAMLCGALSLPALAAANTRGYEAEVARLVNIERAKDGKAALKYGNKALNDACRQRAKEIATYFSHDRPDGSECWTVWDEFGIEGYATGENIAAGQSSASAVMNAWMNSPGHRANILTSSSTWIGVGAYEKNGTLYWVQMFAAGSITDNGDAATPDSSTYTGSGGSNNNNNNNDTTITIDIGGIFSQIWYWAVRIWNIFVSIFNTVIGFIYVFV